MRQMGRAAIAAQTSLFVGGGLVDFSGPQRSLMVISHSAFLVSSVSLLFAVASVCGLRVVGIPRLTFMVVLGLLWGSL